MIQLMRLIQENPIHAIPVEVTRQRLDPLFHTVEIIIVAEARLHTDSLLARLLDDLFPRDGNKKLRSAAPDRFSLFRNHRETG